MTLLAAHSLTVQIAGKHICRDLNLDFAPGQVWALLGRNGSGKTTLLHTLAGLRAAHSGEVRMDDRAVTDFDGRALAQRRAVLFQDSQDTFPASVLETVLAGRHPHLSFWALESAADRDLANAALREVDLADQGARLVTTLSGGERRRVAIAALLVQNPAVWLLDEPSNHLDLHHQVELLNLLTERARANGGVIVMSLHDVNLALRFCSHALLLAGPDEIMAGAVDGVINAENLTRTYGHGVRQLRDDAGRSAWLPD